MRRGAEESEGQREATWLSRVWCILTDEVVWRMLGFCVGVKACGDDDVAMVVSGYEFIFCVGRAAVAAGVAGEAGGGVAGGDGQYELHCGEL